MQAQPFASLDLEANEIADDKTALEDLISSAKTLTEACIVLKV